MLQSAFFPIILPLWSLWRKLEIPRFFAGGPGTASPLFRAKPRQTFLGIWVFS